MTASFERATRVVMYNFNNDNEAIERKQQSIEERPLQKTNSLLDAIQGAF